MRGLSAGSAGWFGPLESTPEEKRRLRKTRIKRKYHPKYVAAARELCARYLEEVQAGRFLPEAQASGKYDVSRALEGSFATESTEPPDIVGGFKLLDAV